MIPPGKKITIQDIARELNTTSSTVSRALNDNPRISKKMRKAVQEFAQKHNYQPDFRAASLRKGSGKTIGVMVPKIDRHFFATVLSGIDEIITSYGYNSLICQTFESLEKEEQLVNSLMHGKVDGLIASISTQTKTSVHFEQWVNKNLPLVFFDRVIDSMQVSKVVINDYYGGCLAMEHLIEAGAKKIVHFAGPQHINVYRDRTRAYKDMLNKNNIPYDEKLVFENTITRETGYKAMNEIARWKKLPDALFSSGDYSALGAILCAKDHNISVPGDFIVTGFANEPWNSFFDPPLTSIDQHAFDIGRQAAKLLIEQIENHDITFLPRTILLNPELIIRKSSTKQI
ncbi:MAG: LacI family DNA-binding transcriptional regulator [Bacteroidota bacterium]